MFYGSQALLPTLSGLKDRVGPAAGDKMTMDYYQLQVKALKEKS